MGLLARSVGSSAMIVGLFSFGTLHTFMSNEQTPSDLPDTISSELLESGPEPLLAAPVPVTGSLNILLGTNSVSTSIREIPCTEAARALLADEDAEAMLTTLGAVQGPASSTDNGFAKWDGTSGKLLKDSLATIGNADIAANAVTFDKLQVVSANVLLGNDASGTAVEEISCTAAGRSLLDDADAAAQRATLDAVQGAASAADGALARFDGVSGKKIKSTPATIGTTDIDNAAVTLAKIANASANSRILGSGASGSGSSYTEMSLTTILNFLGSTANGDFIFKNGSNWDRLPAGTDGQFLRTGGASVPTWETVIPVGSLQMYAGSSIPSGWLGCDGAAVSRTTYAALFAVIGTTWGAGDGSTTFNVPDLRGRAGIGVGTGSGLTARTLAATGGEETHTLAESELPAHTHTVPARNNATGFGSAGAAAKANNVSDSPQTSGSTGGGGAHNNMQPYAVVTMLIRIV